MARKSRRTILECMKALYTKPSAWIKGSLLDYGYKDKPGYCLLGGFAHCIGLTNEAIYQWSGPYGGLPHSQTDKAALKLIARTIAKHPIGAVIVKERFSPDEPNFDDIADVTTVVYEFNDDERVGIKEVRQVLRDALGTLGQVGQ